jgi:hypothetical protein
MDGGPFIPICGVFKKKNLTRDIVEEFPTGLGFFHSGEINGE